MTDNKIKVGVIGGSGLEKMGLLKNSEMIEIDTKWGKPSDSISVGLVGGIEVVVLPRHGRSHHLNPTSVNYRANIQALKGLGVTHVLAACACGSLREEIQPGDLAIVDQFIDRTTQRKTTFYDGGIDTGVCHIPMAYPFCPRLRELYTKICVDLEYRHHTEGTLVTIEGPRFSTKAESHLFRSWNCDVVGMTLSTEATLAREAGLHYASIAMVTDYDCWRESVDDHVSVEKVMKVMTTAGEKVTRILEKAILEIHKNGTLEFQCKCAEWIKTSVF